MARENDTSEADEPRRMLVAGVATLALGAALLVARGRRHATLPPPAPHARAGDRGPPPASTADASRTPSPGANAPPRPAAGPAELALVAPLVPGARLADAEVTAITSVQQGFMHVTALREGRTYDLGVGLARDGVAALRAGRYAVYIFGSIRPDPASFPIADALAHHVQRNADAPPPPGMSEGSLPRSR